MPRDTDKKAYITVSVNKDSDLMRQLIEDERRKGIPKSHLIVNYADEYVRLFIQSEKAPVVVSTAPSVPQIETKASATSQWSDEDLDAAFGE